MLVAYRDVREVPGRVVGLRLPSERLGELLLGAVRGANEATESPVTSANPADEGPRVVDQAGRTMFGEATSAIEGEADEPVSISLGESFPWHLELSLSASLNRYRREREILYGALLIVVVVVAGVAAMITRRGLVRLVELAEMKAEFVANVSHESFLLCVTLSRRPTLDELFGESRLCNSL